MRIFSNLILIFISVSLSTVSTVYLLTGAIPENPFYKNLKNETISSESLNNLPDIKTIVKATEDSVVAIQISKKSEVSENTFYGSGFIFNYNNKNYILTNYHVIQDADKIYVDFLNGNRTEVEVVGSDMDYDLAVLNIGDAKNLKPIQFGDSKKVDIGEWVIAIGNPHGIGHTVTTGIISASDREITMEGRTFEELIQTDAAINPGSSGGPLISLDGKVLGVNTAVLGESQGIGFSVPSHIVVENLDSLIKKGYIDRPFLGVGLIDSEKGVIITEVFKNSPASNKGIKKDDILLKVDNIDVKNVTDLINYVSKNKKVGDEVSLTINRENEIMVVKIVLANKMEILKEKN